MVGNTRYGRSYAANCSSSFNGSRDMIFFGRKYGMRSAKLLLPHRILCRHSDMGEVTEDSKARAFRCCRSGSLGEGVTCALNAL